MKMIKVKIFFVGYLKNKYLTEAIELNYIKPVRIHKILRDAKISLADIFIIKIGTSIVKQDYLLTKSSEVKLVPIIGGG